ncbi:Coiled-coil domain-containing protein 13 [Caenorhabditis elegans]|uniref:Coiled-coil domain-containing protein 13 n=1 Tax=Caenorhabditis elegans TaxID=6239 RepID=O18032_CAEEL|nr:Coiled-coil domain-containing protein 13 [Caenorhabditis elegans]CAB04696.2 Coiled-coil domain-containing protein 13 [Caenorhabditis elegans]|eukprot:NP_492560.2 Uncharacterized protein CELE_T05F1.7 [Caenorhabditis elegans]
MINLEKQISKNRDNLLTFEATVSEIQEKLPQRQKQIDEILRALNEKRREVLQKQNEIAGFRVNRTENSMKSKMEKAKKKLDEMKKKKIVQDKKISRLRSDIARSEKSFDKVEKDIHKEIQRQMENETKKEEIERRIKIFEVENSGISDEFQKLLISLKEDSEGRGKTGDRRIGELEVLMAKGTKCLDMMNEKIENLKEMKLDKSDYLQVTTPVLSKKGSAVESRRRSKSNVQNPKENWKQLEDLKKQIIQLKRESEALHMNKSRLFEEKEALQKTADECQREADRAAQNLRNAENIRISELNRQERKLQPPTLVESKDEKREKEYLEKKEKLAEKIKQIEKSTDEQKTELERIRKRSEFLKRQLKSYSELNLVQFENEKIEKGTEIRMLKKQWHEQIMALNVLNKKLQQRVLQREAAMTKANSVVHLTTNVRDERNREIDELQKEISKTKNKL